MATAPNGGPAFFTPERLRGHGISRHVSSGLINPVFTLPSTSPSRSSQASTSSLWDEPDKAVAAVAARFGLVNKHTPTSGSAPVHDQPPNSPPGAPQ